MTIVARGDLARGDWPITWAPRGAAGYATLGALTSAATYLTGTKDASVGAPMTMA
jgi:hypothetical protein